MQKLLRTAAFLFTIAGVTASSSTARAASWDYLAGGVPAKDFLAAVELGFPALPRLSLQYGILSRFSIGVAVQHDIAAYTYAPRATFTSALGLSLPMRIEAYRGGRLSFGIRLEPGILFVFPTNVVFGMQLGSAFNLGYFIADDFMVGGGIDLPIALFFNNGGGMSGVVPLLFGPIFEFHATESIALTFDLKVGPSIALNGGGSSFGMKSQIGLIFHF